MFLLLLPLIGACDSNDPLAHRGGVQVSFATRDPNVTPAPRFQVIELLGDTIRSGGNTLVIDKAEIVLRKIELKRATAVVCQSGASECQEVEVGPLLVDLPLAGATQQRIMAEVPAGTYNRIDFEIHKLSSDQVDAVLRAQRPDLVDRSIKVQGTFNGVAFTYETDLDVEQELTVLPPLSVTESAATNLTMRVVLSAWFRNATGALVNPATANKGGPNESIVKENIKQSMKAFEDRDRDGREG